PVLARAVAAIVEAAELGFSADRQPYLEEAYAVGDDAILEFRGLVEKELLLLGRAETHDRLDDRAVVPGPIEGHELSGRRIMCDMALVIPLAALGLRRLLQSHVAGRVRVHILPGDEDGAAISGRVAPLEEYHHPLAGFLQPALQLH